MRQLALRISHKLHADQETATANLANPRLPAERGAEGGAQLQPTCGRSLHKFLVSKDLQHGARDRGTWNGVAISEAVHEA